MNWITQAIDDLIIKSDNELHSRIELIEKDFKFDSTETSAHFYFKVFRKKLYQLNNKLL